MLLVWCEITEDATRRRQSCSAKILDRYLVDSAFNLPSSSNNVSFFSFFFLFLSHKIPFSLIGLHPTTFPTSSTVVAGVGSVLALCGWTSGERRGCFGGLRSSSQNQDKQVEEDGTGSGGSVGQSKECLQAERTAYPVCAGRGHRLPVGLLPERQAALRAGQLVKVLVVTQKQPCPIRIPPPAILPYPPHPPPQIVHGDSLFKLPFNT